MFAERYLLIAFYYKASSALFSFVVLQKEPDQIFLLEGRTFFQIQHFKKPAYPVLKGIFMDKQIFCSLGYAAAAVIIAPCRDKDGGQLRLMENSRQLMVQALHKVFTAGRGGIKHIVTPGGQLPDIIKRHFRHPIQGGGLFIPLMDIPDAQARVADA